MAGKNIETIYGLTPLQEGILFHTLENPGSGVYFEQYCCALEGDVDDKLMRRAWQAVAARHQVLRTLFTWEKRDRPLQIVRRRVELPFESLEWSAYDAAEQERRLATRLRLDRDRGFDLERAPLSRVTLIRTGPDRHRMIWSFHHLLVDGWSMRLILDEVLACHDAFLAGREHGLPSAPAFAGFVAWLKQRETRGDEAFWREQLKGFTTPVCPEVGATGQDEHPDGAPAGVCEHRLERAALARLRDSARGERLTLNTLVLGAWALLLARYADRSDVVFGTTVAGRPPDLADVELTAGLFINTLPLRVRVDDDTTLRDYLRAIQSRQIAMRDREQTALVDVQRQSDVPAGTPLFETIVVFENFPAREANAAQPRLAITQEDYIEYSNFPLALLAVPEDELRLIAVYNPHRFGKAAVTRMLQHVGTTLEAMSGSLDRRVSAVSIMPPSERQRVLEQWNDSEADLGPDVPVQRLIEDYAERTPDAPAIFAADGTLSYGQLNERANRLAHFLIAQGASADSGVVIYAERGALAITGILAVLKAGAAYVPVDPGYPAKRLHDVLDDLGRLGSPLVLTQTHLLDRVPRESGRVICLDDDLPSHPADNPRGDFDAGQLAYIIYTSGSTGRPKGVMVSHGNLLNSTRARKACYEDAVSAFLLLSSLATDSSVAGVFWTLCSGAALVLPAARAEQDIESLSRLVEERQVSHTLCVPSLYSLILENAPAEALASLRAVIVAGEACRETLVALHHRTLAEATLYNEYGPSEATVWASVAQLGAETAHSGVTIGKPIANVRLYVLDSAMRPLPAGVAGELYIGGTNVARGYLHQPDKTAEVFLSDPFSDDPDARLYKTGDRARWRSDGSLEFAGRVDHQLKLRGFRVEPGEIESVLRAHAQVDEAVVFIDDGQDEATSRGRLTAALTAAGNGATDGDELRRFCQASLPGHMVPQRFVTIDELPRTPAGKVDRRAIAAMEWDSRPGTPDTAPEQPRNDIEACLASIWAAVLGADEVGVHDNFFELGGDSLLSIRILSRAGKEGLRISPEAFFSHPTIAAQARVATVASPAKAETGLVTGPYPLLPIQRWFFRTITRDPQHWNQSLLFVLTDRVSQVTLERGVQKLLLHHDALRTRFEEGDAGWTAHIDDLRGALPVHWIDLTGTDPASRSAKITERATELNASFQLDSSPLIRFAMFDAGSNQPQQLLIVAHHLVVDAASLQIIADDLQLLLAAYGRDETPRLPAKTLSIRSWAAHLLEYARGSDVREQAAYWRQRADSRPWSMPLDGERPADEICEHNVRAISATCEEATTQQLVQELPQAFRCRTVDVLVSALARVLASWSRSACVQFDMEGHGREALFADVDVSRTVGWFTTMFPVTLRADSAAGWQDAAAALRSVKEQLRAIPMRGLGYGLLSEYSDEDGVATLPQAARPPVLFNYLGREDSTGDGQAILRLEEGVCGVARSERANRTHLIEINVRFAHGRLLSEWRYIQGIHTRETVEQLATGYVAALEDLIAARSATGDVDTPSDFPLANLDQEQLDGLSDLLGDLDT